RSPRGRARTAGPPPSRAPVPAARGPRPRGGRPIRGRSGSRAGAGARPRAMSPPTRPATPDDAAEVHRLIAALAAYEREPDAVLSTPEVIRAQLADPRPPIECFLAEDEGTPVGFALFFATYS